MKPNRKPDVDWSKYSKESFLLYGRWPSYRWDYSHHVIPPITASTNFSFPSVKAGGDAFSDYVTRRDGGALDEYGYVYDRLGEPTKELLEEGLAVSEDGDLALVFASGMAAISAVFGILIEQGDQILYGVPVYGCTDDLLNLWCKGQMLKNSEIKGVPLSERREKFADNENVRAISLTSEKGLQELENAITERTRVLYIESPTNPTIELVDLEKVSSIVQAKNKNRERRIFLVMDNTFASPCCQRPLNYGVDIVVHSLTKFIGGFGTVMGGAAIMKKEHRKEAYGPLLQYRKDFGGALSANSAWHILVYGLPTLPMRMRAAQENAQAIVEFLENKKNEGKIDRIVYPSMPEWSGVAEKQMRGYDGKLSPGAMLYFVLSGDGDPELAQKRGTKFMDHVAGNAYCITLAVSLGQIRSLLEHPSSMTHGTIPPREQVNKGIDPGGIRMSVGIEPISDLIRDLEGALKAAFS